MTAQVIDFLLAGLSDNSGQPLTAGKVYTYIAGTLTPKSTYLNLALDLEQNPIILDANGVKQVYADGNYKLVIKDSDDNLLYTFDYVSFGSGGTDFGGDELTNIANATARDSAISYGQVQDGKPPYVPTVTGTANSILLTNTVAIPAYVTGQLFRFKALNSNTGALTVTVDGLSAIDARKVVNGSKVALVQGDVIANDTYDIFFDGTHFVFLRAGDVYRVASSAALIATVGGTANAITLTTSPRVTAVAGMVVRYVATATSTGPVQINLNAGGLVDLKFQNLGGLNAGDIVAGGSYAAFFDGTRWIHADLGRSLVIGKEITGTVSSNTTGETTLKAFTIPANSLQAGRAVRMTAWGVLACAQAGKTFTFKLKLNSTEMAPGGAGVAIAIDADAGYWRYEALILADAINTQKAMLAFEDFLIIGTPGSSNTFTSAKDSLAEDGTADMTLTLTGTMNSANAGNHIDLHGAILEYL